MDLFSLLPRDVQTGIFNISRKYLETIHRMVTSMTQPDLPLDNQNRLKQLFSTHFIENLPINKVDIEEIDNPFQKWRRSRRQNMFQHGHKRLRIPYGAFKRTLKQDTAYAVRKYYEQGTYGQVLSFVVYNNRAAVIKITGEESDDFFEMVTQAYLHETCKKYAHIRVPEILFLQRKQFQGELRTCVCMELARGMPLGKLSGKPLYKALAYVMKALYTLQADVNFMHRDLSCSNVLFDDSNNNVTFIDFGMSCVNPESKEDAWQSAHKGLIPLERKTTTSRCTNRSLDSSLLIASLSDVDGWCRRQHEQMKIDYKVAIMASKNVSAKKKLGEPVHSKQFTLIKKNGPWSVGNNISARGRNYWWVFNMTEFPVPDWYPENVLRHILPLLPITDWPPIRRKWQKTFDKIVKGITIVTSDGDQGKLVKLVHKKCRIELMDGVIDVAGDECTVRTISM